MHKLFILITIVHVLFAAVKSNSLNNDCPFRCIVNKIKGNAFCMANYLVAAASGAAAGPSKSTILDCKLNVISMLEGQALYELSLGSGESVSHIDLTGLGSATARYVERLNLNLNILRLQNSLLLGFDHLAELTVHSVAFIENEIFYRLPYLTSISFYNYQTEVLPRYLLFNTSRGQDNERTGREITIDLMVQCHRCAADTNRLVLVPHAVQNSFVMETIFSDACKIAANNDQLGCEDLIVSSLSPNNETEKKKSPSLTLDSQIEHKLLQLPKHRFQSASLSGDKNFPSSSTSDLDDTKPRLVERHLNPVQQQQRQHQQQLSRSDKSVQRTYLLSGGGNDVKVNYLVLGGILLWCVSLTVAVIVLIVLMIRSRRNIRRIGYIIETNPPCSKNSLFNDDQII